MKTKYYNITVSKDTPSYRLEIFRLLSKHRLFTPKTGYRLSELWRGCKERIYHGRYSLAVTFDKEIPVGVVCYEPDDKKFLSCFIKVDYRNQHLATRLARIVIKNNNYPVIWCLGKSQRIVEKLAWWINRCINWYDRVFFRSSLGSTNNHYVITAITFSAL